MSIAWAGIVNEVGELPATDKEKIRAYLDAFGDRVAKELEEQGLSRFVSPLFRPFNLIVGKHSDGSYNIVLSPLSGGIATYRWLEITGGHMPIEGFVAEVRQQLGWDIAAALTVPDLDKRRIAPIAKQHVEGIASAARMSKVGSLQAASHLRPYLEGFLADHHEPDRTVFVMMPFGGSEHLDLALKGIHDAVRSFGFAALRADDKAYSDQLWLNVETYLVGCRYGIAVFEDLDDRQFNPNVSLDWGTCLG